MSEVVGNDNELPAAGVLRSQHGQPPSHHANLKDGKDLCVSVRDLSYMLLMMPYGMDSLKSQILL